MTLSPTGDRSHDVEGLCREVRVSRFSLFAAAAAALQRASFPSTAVADGFAAIAGMTPRRRDYYLSDPALGCWLDALLIALMQPATTRAALLARAGQLPPLLERIEARRKGTGFVHVGDTGILLQRDELDPVIKAITPPTYDFAAAGRKPVGRRQLERFAAILAEAFANIRAADPERHAQLCRLIRVIGYLPDLEFRSCSAARYQGVVYLAGDEESIVDLEESIVHEGAHQLLYKIGELSPITERAALETEYELPWSGSVRDLFGYYHAYFIYLEVVKYYDRRAPSTGAARPRTERIRQLIHRGLEFATDDIRSAAGLTPAGRALFGRLAGETAALRGPTLAAVA